ncbi:hypothetical protein WJX73_001108 [Symbiochloris irregularis]|uniref:Peroxisomal membrane protein PMP22 n=1 Tax=Symbiochloris irregularis TaxID=706552 RepID=A0AAW1P8J2_9CHLO
MSREPGVLELAWRRYQRELSHQPLRTKALTSCALAGLSDLAAQKVHAQGSIRWSRTGLMALYGLLWTGPAGHYWQNFVQKLFAGKKDPNSIAAKVILENLTFSPLMNSMFMAYVSIVIEGNSAQKTRQNLQASFAAVQAQAWKLWPLVSIINYTYVPLRFRVLVMNVVALFWSTFLNLRSRSVAAKQLT